MTFRGIPPAAIEFLRELGRNNARGWFAEHRARYETALVAPLCDLVREIAPSMLEIDPALVVAPRVGRTVSRINRDVRFSRDKSPYRTTMWVVFKRATREMRDTPTFFFELGTSGYRYGMGWYAASPATMRAFRAEIDDDVRAFATLVRALPLRRFSVAGEPYSRPPGGEKPAAVREFYGRKNVYLVRQSKADSSLFAPGLARTLAKDFAALQPAYHFMLAALERTRAE